MENNMNAIESMLAAAVTIIPIGVAMISSGNVWPGLAVVVVGVAIVFARGYVKNTLV